MRNKEKILYNSLLWYVPGKPIPDETTLTPGTTWNPGEEICGTFCANCATLGCMGCTPWGWGWGWGCGCIDWTFCGTLCDLGGTLCASFCCGDTVTTRGDTFWTGMFLCATCVFSGPDFSANYKETQAGMNLYGLWYYLPQLRRDKEVCYKRRVLLSPNFFILPVFFTVPFSKALYFIFP